MNKTWGILEPEWNNANTTPPPVFDRGFCRYKRSKLRRKQICSFDITCVWDVGFLYFAQGHEVVHGIHVVHKVIETLLLFFFFLRRHVSRLWVAKKATSNTPWIPWLCIVTGYVKPTGLRGNLFLIAYLLFLYLGLRGDCCIMRLHTSPGSWADRFTFDFNCMLTPAPSHCDPEQ